MPTTADLYGPALGDLYPIKKRGRPVHRAEPAASMLRTLVKASEKNGRPRSLRSEGLQVMEGLGYLHRRRRTEDTSNGVLARRKKILPRPAPDKNLKQVREWRSQRLRAAYDRDLRQLLAKPINEKSFGQQLDRIEHRHRPEPSGASGFYLGPDDDSSRHTFARSTAFSFGPRPPHQ